MAARPTSSPPADVDGDGGTVHHSTKFLAGKGEEIMGSPSTNPIEEWIGLVHAMVRGPPATTTAKTEQSSTILQLKEKRGSKRGRGRVRFARESSGAPL